MTRIKTGDAVIGARRFLIIVESVWAATVDPQIAGEERRFGSIGLSKTPARAQNAE